MVIAVAFFLRVTIIKLYTSATVSSELYSKFGLRGGLVVSLSLLFKAQ